MSLQSMNLPPGNLPPPGTPPADPPTIPRADPPAMPSANHPANHPAVYSGPDDARDSSPAPARARVLVFSPYALWPSHTTYEEVMAEACRARGAEVEYLLCDGLPECDQHWDSKSPEGRPPDLCQRCRAASRAAMERTGFPSTALGDWLAPGEREAASAWVRGLPAATLREAQFRGLPLGQWVLSSVISYFRHYPPAVEDAHVAAVYRGFLEGAAVVAAALGRRLDERPAEAAILFNGRQSHTRVALEIFRARGVRVLTHERAEYLRGHINVKPNAHCMSTVPFREHWARWRGVPLERAELDGARRWLLQRRYGANLAWIPFNRSYRQDAAGPNAAGQSAARQNAAGDEATGDDAAGRDAAAHPVPDPGRRSSPPRPPAKLWALFTSSTDEVAGDPLWQGPYGSQSDWVRDVVEWVGGRRDVELVIKVHPNLGGNLYIGRAAGELGFYERLAATLPANVRMIFPEEPVSAYALADRADLVLTFGSTIGMEMAMLAKPVLLASRAIYEDLATLRRVDAPASLPALLEACLDAAPDREIQREAFRLASRFFSTELPFPAVTVHDLFDVALDTEYRDRGGWESDPTLARICGFLLEGAELYAPPTAADLARGPEEEDRFFDELARDPARWRNRRYESMLRLKDLARRTMRALDRAGIPADLWLVNAGRRRWHALLRRLERGDG
jgi:hypothetical protein